MYTLLRESLPATEDGAVAAPRRRGMPRTGRVVLLLGLTSLFTDISSEMVNAVLPLYFIARLGFTPLQFGFIDGLYQGASALVRLGSGYIADRTRGYKAVAVAGYGLSAVSRIALPLAGASWGMLSAVILVDRTGKGIRTAPRDAMIAADTPTERLGVVFGVHRALDTLGALLGPVFAFAILRAATGAYDAIFVASFCFALVGLAILVLFVQERPAAAPTAKPAPRPSLRAAAGLLSAPPFRALLLAASALALFTISDSFLYLVLQRRLDFAIGLFPLLYVATSLAYFVLAIPAGWLADRVGRGRVFVGGYVLLILAYSALLRPSFGTEWVIVYVALLGAFYAATDGVLSAQASALLPAELRGSGLALLSTATSLARLGGSILFGALWTLWGPRGAVAPPLAGLVLATLAAAVILAHTRSRHDGSPA